MPFPPEDFLRRMYERSPVGFYRSSFAGRFSFVNPALARMLGYGEPREILQLGLEPQRYWDPADHAALIAQHGDGGVLDGAKVRWRTRSDAQLVVRLYGSLRRDEDCIDATVIDVTELEAAQVRIEQQRAELERSATTLRLLWKQLPGLVWTIDRELRITSAAGAAIAHANRKAEDELGKTLYQFFGVDRDSFLPIRRHREALAGRWVAYHQEAGGKQYAVTLAPHRNERGEIVGAIGVGLDVTTRHHLEQRMVDAQRAESLGVLAGGLAHDFNNLLVAILGNAELGLRDAAVDAPVAAALHNVRAAALDASALTSQLLAYAGRSQVVAVDLEIAPIIQELLRLAAPQIPAQVRVTVELPEELPQVRGDAAQLRQVVMNLLTNARDAVLPGGGAVKVRAYAVERPDDPSEHEVLTPPAGGHFVCVEIADDGAGMDAATLRRSFDPFFSTKPNGHGLGLASVLGIVRSHGGGVSVQSTPQRGTVVHVLWPVRRERAEVRCVRPGIFPGAPGRRTVLVVDDDDAVRDVLSQLLAELGYGVLARSSGPAALELVDGATELDAMLVDLTMPEMSGNALVQEVRRRRPRLPIIVCTGADRDRVGVPDVEGLLSKPFRVDELESMLLRVVGGPGEAKAT